jgi:hypothetical protein
MTRCDRIVGGASRDRTDDLRVANATLSQLSYGPVRDLMRSTLDPNQLVGLGGVEPPTSPLSGVRSNQLSYRPSQRETRGLRRAAHEGLNQLNIRIGNL